MNNPKAGRVLFRPVFQFPVMNKNGLKNWAKENRIELSDSLPNFRIGQNVTFTNEFGVKFSGLKIIGFRATPILDGNQIYVDCDSWWFPKKPTQLHAE